MKKEEIEAAASSEPPAVEVRKAKLRQLLAQLKRADLEKREGGQHEEPLRRLDAKDEQRQPEPQQPPEASHLSERRDLSSSRRARGASSGGGGRPRRRSPSVAETPPLPPESSLEPQARQAPEDRPRKREAAPSAPARGRQSGAGTRPLPRAGGMLCPLNGTHK